MAHSVTISFPDSSAQAPSTETFTCITCHMIFKDGVGQRDHYRSDVHRFNTKRKVAGLAPVSAEVYDSKQKALKDAENEKQATANATFDCVTCNKKFHSEAQLSQHLETKKHKQQEARGPVPKFAKAESSSETSSEASVAKPEVPALTAEQLMTMTDEEIYEWRLKTCKQLELTDCLFCKESSPTLKANMRHMSSVHGFFIPDLDYLEDLEGLLKYLGEKISVGWTCLTCNGKGKAFHSMEAVQDHMRTMGHCKLAYDTDEEEEEYADFFDFSEYYKEQGFDPEVGPPDIVQNEFGELILPNSKLAGNRALKHVYKQNKARLHRHDNALVRSLAAEYKANLQKADQLAKLPPSREARRNREMSVRVDMQANKLVRLRFRSDCPI